VFKHLQAKCTQPEQGVLRETSAVSTISRVEWMNQNFETGMPFDIKMVDVQEAVTYVEVRMH
jgi:hypothetical protein